MCQGQWDQCRAAAWQSSPWYHHPLIWGTVQVGNLEGNFQSLQAACGTCQGEVAQPGDQQGPTWGTGTGEAQGLFWGLG